MAQRTTEPPAAARRSNTASGVAVIPAALLVADPQSFGIGLITDPGLGHLMNLTSKYSPGVGNPDGAVIKDVTSWLVEHR